MQAGSPDQGLASPQGCSGVPGCTQGFHPGCWPGPGFALGLLILVLLWLPLSAASACDLLPLRPLAPGLWLVPAPAAESDAGNRGQSSHLLLAREGAPVGRGQRPDAGLRCAAALAPRSASGAWRPPT